MSEQIVYLVKAEDHYLWIGETRAEAELAMAEVFVDGLKIVRAEIREIEEEEFARRAKPFDNSPWFP